MRKLTSEEARNRLIEMILPLGDDGVVVLSKRLVLALTGHPIWCSDVETSLRTIALELGGGERAVQVFNLERKVVLIDKTAPYRNSAPGVFS